MPQTLTFDEALDTVKGRYPGATFVACDGQWSYDTPSGGTCLFDTLEEVLGHFLAVRPKFLNEG